MCLRHQRYSPHECTCDFTALEKIANNWNTEQQKSRTDCLLHHQYGFDGNLITNIHPNHEKQIANTTIMSNESKSSNKAALTGVVAALAASSCCIPPVIALIAGVGGASSSLAWMEPFRPYLIGLAVISIGYAWYANLKSKEADDCGCDVEEPKFYQTKGFLIGMTLFAGASIAFPYYADTFYTDSEKEVVVVDSATVKKIEVSIEGMTCDACQNHVNHAVNELPGIIGVTSSYADGNAIIEFDETQSSAEDIEAAINGTGYHVAALNVAKDHHKND